MDIMEWGEDQAKDEHRIDLTTIPPRSSLRFTPRFSRVRLEHFRRCGDPLADEIAEELHSHHGGLTSIHDLLSTVRAKAAPGNIFERFLQTVAEVPSWADRSLVERGQRLHAVTYPFQGLSLFSGSLVGGAQFSTASIVTALAGNITQDPTRRINETGMLLAAIALPGELLEPGGAAHDSLTRVRLLHAALRHWLPRSGRLKRHRELAAEGVYVEGEKPLNQQDLAITLGVFNYINLRSLRRMGVILSRGDVDAYTHMWRYAGYVLGIDDELLPRRIEDQEEFMKASMLHQGSPESIQGESTREFIDAFARQASDDTGGLMPFGALQTFLYQLTVYLNGKDYTEGMGIPDLGASHWSIRLVRSVGFVFGTVLPRLPFGEALLFKLHTSAIRAALKKRGTPIGHAAGSGAPLAKSRL